MSDYTLSATKGISFSCVIPPEDGNHSCASYTGTLPPGISVSFSGGNATLSGTPTTPGGGTYDCVIVETNSLGGGPGNLTVEITVVDPTTEGVPVISCSGATATQTGGTLSVPAGAVNLMFETTNCPPSGGGNNAAWSYSAPTGLSLGTGGNYLNTATLLLGGTLTAGNYSVPVSFYNQAYAGGSLQTATYILALTVMPVVPVVSLASSATLNVYVGGAVSAQCSVQTNTGTVTWSATNLPTGCALNAASGLISGTPTAAGSFATVVTATNSSGAGTMEVDFVIQALPLPVISLANGAGLTTTVGSSISAQFSVPAAAGTVTWAATGLPYGCSMNPSTGLVSGSPMASGTRTATITATNSTGAGSFSAVFVVNASSSGTTAPAFQFLSDDPTLVGVVIETTTGAVSLSRSTPLKAGITAQFCLVFLASGQAMTPPDVANVEMGMRVSGKYNSDYLFALPTFTLQESAADGLSYLLGEVPLSGDALTAEFKSILAPESADAAVSPLTVMSDVAWQTPEGKSYISDTFTFQIAPAVTT